jgi:hypothetical protein
MPGKLHLGRLIADLAFDFWPMLTLQFENMTAGMIGLIRELRNWKESKPGRRSKSRQQATDERKRSEISALPGYLSTSG